MTIAKAEAVEHISQVELLLLMKGNGKGKAKWPNAFEVQQFPFLEVFSFLQVFLLLGDKEESGGYFHLFRLAIVPKN